MQLNFEGQVIAANVETRTIKGVVVPFARVGNTSAGPVRFEFGAFGDIDPSQIVLNSEHDRTRPLGRGIANSLEVSPAGISMAFKIAPTNAGNDALVEAAEGLRPAFSVEAKVNEYTIEKGVMVVASANLEAVAHVTSPAFVDAKILEVAASDTEETPETTEAEIPAEENPQENTVENETTTPVADEVTAAAVVIAAAPVAYTKPRSPINSPATYLEHKIKATMGNHDSAQYVMAADTDFTGNPGLNPVQYVSTVIDTSIGNRPAIDAIGSRAITASGMVISHPKITQPGLVEETAEADATPQQAIETDYVNLDVLKYSGSQTVSLELLERSSPDFIQAMLDNMTRQYNQATDSAVIAALTAGGTAATSVAATSDGIIDFVSTEAAAAYLATGELPAAYIAGVSQWSLLMGATDSTGRPIYNAYNPMNNAGVAGPRSLRGNVLGLDLWVDSNAVSTTIDESAFIVTPSSVAIYESNILRLSTNVVSNGQIQTMLYGYMATGVLVAGGVRRFQLT
jgi:HK97 family phage major capsid protein